MRDSLAMRGVERVGDLRAEPHDFRHRQRALDRHAFDVLHDEIVLAHIEQRADVRMIQARDRFGFPLEALAETAIYLDRHRAIEPRVASLPHRAHAARANRRFDTVRSQGRVEPRACSRLPPYFFPPPGGFSRVACRARSCQFGPVFVQTCSTATRNGVPAELAPRISTVLRTTAVFP